MARRMFFAVALAGSVLFSLLGPSALFAESAAPAVTNERIMQRLDAMHGELKALRKEVGELRQAVRGMQRNTARAPARAQRPPAPQTVKLDDDPVLGSRQAAVGIIEFSDFQCPFCNRFHAQTFPRLKATYIDKGTVQYIFRDFPLGFHREAKNAAVAANCAGSQDAYWKMHHALFSNQRRLNPDVYKELATSLRLDVPTFQSCMQDPAHSKEVDADMAYGQSIGVRGTPNFFIGKVKDGQLVEAQQLTGAQPYAAFERLITALLKADDTSATKTDTTKK